jgi:hypothetical protein
MTIAPFFVIGFQRSGTTLLRVMLDSHPQVSVPLDVTGLWWRFEARLPRYGDLAAEANRRALVADLLGEERIRLWKATLTVDQVLGGATRAGYPGIIEGFYRAYAAHQGKSAWGDKDPGNLVRLHVLNRWFPDCRVVHLIRDGRAACLSLKAQAFGPDDLLDCACAWREEVGWARRMGELLGPDRYLELTYERLLDDPARELGLVTAFLGFPYAAEMLRYPERIRESVPDEKRHIWPLIGEPPRKDNAERWRSLMGRGVQVCFEKRAGELLEELGYETTPRPWRGAYATEVRFLGARVLRALRQRVARPRSDGEG